MRAGYPDVCSDPSTHMNPAVSIVTPTFNRAHLLPRVWASIVRQTETNFEWIVVDDGSSDDTQEVVLGFNDPRIHYVHQDNRGVNEARNHGDSKVRADYVVHLDSDDELLNETTLAEMLSEVRAAHPKVAWVGFTVVDAEGRTAFSHLPAERIEVDYVDQVCGRTMQGEFFRIYRRSVAEIATWPHYRGLLSLRYWRIARHRPGLMINRPARIYHQDADDRLTGAAAAIERAGDMAAAHTELISEHKAAWKRHCPCQIGKYHFYRAMYVALSDISIRAFRDLIFAFRYGSMTIRAKAMLLLGALVFPVQVRRWMFLKWSSR